MSNEELIKMVKEYLDDEMAAGKKQSHYHCKCTKDNTLHVFKGESNGREYWTCYECGTTGIKKSEKDV